VLFHPVSISLIRKICPAEFLMVTPGVRARDAKEDDQKRVLTPREAIHAGADYLVIGRPILRASGQKIAAKRL
jgi:orotidine-5'-phosphate decarboxylase